VGAVERSERFDVWLPLRYFYYLRRDTGFRGKATDGAAGAGPHEKEAQRSIAHTARSFEERAKRLFRARREHAGEDEYLSSPELRELQEHRFTAGTAEVVVIGRLHPHRHRELR
jgi:hypothetical protein